MSAPRPFDDAERLASALFEALGHHIRLALPLGIGKANRLANALFDRAAADPELTLEIYTALTLTSPEPDNTLARRFLGPLKAKFFQGYPDLHYARALKNNTLPDNIRVTEFFLQPGNWLGHRAVQQSYSAINYTHALDFLQRKNINLVAQLVAPPNTEHPQTFNLSSNPDITPDLLQLRREGKADFAMVAEVNSQLPFMQGAAICDREEFDYVLDNDKTHFALFRPPQQPAAIEDHAIALHTAGLIKDGGTLQIGIGSIGDAIANALILRHRHSDQFSAIADALGAAPESEREPFAQGVYGLSEMLVESFLALLERGIVARDVDGACLHAGFFMGSPHFYRALEHLPDDKRRAIAMMPVSFINQLYGDEKNKRSARKHARFINSAMMATLTGAVISDGLEDAQVISGVGGQYNFVEQAHALGDSARSIITVRATRRHKGKVSSNIRWQYGHCTIPRHLRDMVVTEYGVADLRGRSDQDVIKAMLAIADSRFQPQLMRAAKRAGKVAESYHIPERYRHNTPESLRHLLRPAADRGYLAPFPLGSDFSPEEERLVQALSLLSEQAGAPLRLLSVLFSGLTTDAAPYSGELKRMGLQKLHSPREWLEKNLLKGALRRTHSHP